MEANPTSSSLRRVIVVGGGLAGMAAAVALESVGISVTLLESRRTLGGRAGSFEEPQTGEELDNCQHVLLGCCTNLLDFYERLGVRKLIRWDRAVHFVDLNGRRYDLFGTPGLPAPLHLSWSMTRFSLLTVRERFAFSQAMRAMIRMGRAGAAALGDQRFGDWLTRYDQSPELIRKMYDPVLISALNEQSRDVASSYAIQVFQEAMLFNRGGYVVGLPDCPLSRLYSTLPVRDVRLGARVARLRFDGPKAVGVDLASGEGIDADAVVLATNHHAARRYVPEGLIETDSRFAHLDQLVDVPILGVHLWFDRPVLTHSQAAFVEGPLQWVFRKDPSGASVHGVISAAREWAGIDKQSALGTFEKQIRLMLPMAREAKLLRGVVVVEKRATFSPAPGIDRLRPSQAPPARGVEHLYLAGDYTLTGWPATMEGAVRSGYLAAGAVACQLVKATAPFVVNDLPIEWPSRWLRSSRA